MNLIDAMRFLTIEMHEKVIDPDRDPQYLTEVRDELNLMLHAFDGPDPRATLATEMIVLADALLA